jgi:soluble lytic murein transglycosylase-like protein
MRLKRLLVVPFVLLAAGQLHAEYFVLRSGQRLSVTGYERRGDIYRLQLAGGYADVPATEVLAIEPEEVFRSVPSPANNLGGPFAALILESAKRYGVDADLITCVIAVESNFNPQAVSRRNARGLMQLLPETAARLGVKNIFDPHENVDAGTRYLRELLQRYDDNIVLALAAYNAGPDRVQQFGRVPPYRETQSYVRRIKRAFDEKKSRQPDPKAATGAKQSSKTPGGQPL